MRNKLFRTAVATVSLTGAIVAGAATIAPAANASTSLVYTSSNPCDPSYHQVIVGTGAYGTLVYACYK